ncbi:hypothetical protein BYT27DRAFT_7079561 [Phlegmacium glaucopus]|nr:hypothetical protein BYT27DRAFT_7079561 [Phlegmacium glaucopus]
MSLKTKTRILCQKTRTSSLKLDYLISYANRAARFISAYGQGLSSLEAAWANRKYHGHCTLPPDMALKLKKEHKKKYGT